MFPIEFRWNRWECRWESKGCLSLRWMSRRIWPLPRLANRLRQSGGARREDRSSGSVYVTFASAWGQTGGNGDESKRAPQDAGRRMQGGRFAKRAETGLGDEELELDVPGDGFAGLEGDHAGVLPLPLFSEGVAEVELGFDGDEAFGGRRVDLDGLNLG